MKKLAINVALAFAAGFFSVFGALVATTPKNPGLAVVIAAAAAGAWAGFRAVVGLIAAKVAGTTPQ